MVRSDGAFLFEHRIPIESLLCEVNIAEARQIFSALFDRAARAVTLAGLDLDDVLVDRFAWLRNKAGDLVRVPVDELATDDVFRQALELAYARIAGSEAVAGEKWVAKMGVVARREADNSRTDRF